MKKAKVGHEILPTFSKKVEIAMASNGIWVFDGHIPQMYMGKFGVIQTNVVCKRKYPKHTDFLRPAPQKEKDLNYVPLKVKCLCKMDLVSKNKKGQLVGFCRHCGRKSIVSGMGVVNHWRCIKKALKTNLCKRRV